MSRYVDSKIAYVEDCAADGNETVSGTRQFAQANASRRQSYQPPLVHKGLKGDEVSDSGYSSHAGATVASEDSVPEHRHHLLPRRLSKAKTSESPKKRRPTLFPSKTVANSHSNDLSLKGGSSSRSSGKAKPLLHERCNCDQCLSGMKGVPSSSSPLERPWDLELPPVEPRPRYKEALPTSASRRLSTGPSSVPQEYQPRPRAMTSTSRPRRPMSYHSGSSYGDAPYAMQSYDAPYDRGPPLSSSAYMNMPAGVSYVQSLPTYPPPSPQLDYSDPYQYPTSRSLPRRLPPDYTTPLRPTSVYDPAYGEYDDVLAPEWSRDRRPSRMEPTFASSYDSQREEDYRKMPPPPAPRPIGRHSYSTNEIRRSGSIHASDTGATISADRLRGASTTNPSSVPRSHRPSMSSANSGKKSRSYNDGLETTQVESSSRRRASYIGPERMREQERNAEAHQHASGTVPADRYQTPPRKVRPSGSSSGSHSRASSSRDGSESRTRAGSSSKASNDGLKMWIDPRSGLHMNLTGVGGHAISLNSGQDGEPIEVSIGRQKYNKDVRTSRDARSTTHSRRSSKAPSILENEREPQWI
ncbi:MAG: hypothetical protein M1837_004020 [Sclerophora amabilis]|nr:MAG: hypothetical protein M1837_004020 [Sclerophora amabilis]